LQARFQLDAGDLTSVQRWADARTKDEATIAYLQHAREELLVARLLLARGQAGEAAALLARIQDAAQRAGHTRYALETQVLLALAHSAGQQQAEARRLLQAALAHAAREGYARLFLDEGAALLPLLRASLPDIHDPALAAYLRSLLHAFAAEHWARDSNTPLQAAPLTEPLSPQEQRVLRLLAAGRTNPEIANHLIVSVNTVKAHLKNIYRKLGVRNRMQAVQRVTSDQ
jgi:LuxR family maltose regulon positive regulatory protein